MKFSMTVTVILLLGGAGGPAAAACSDDGYTTQLRSTGGNTINGALDDKRIRATGGEEWNEDHCSNGALYKVGVSDDDPVDPRAYRGMWSVSGNGSNSVVNYNYTVGGSSTFSYSLWQNDMGGLCWEALGGGGNIIATAPAPGSLSGTCAIP